MTAALVLLLAQVASSPPAAAATSSPAVTGATAATAAPASAPDAGEDEPRANLVIPLAHVAALMTVMRVGESVIWPDPFSRTRYFGAHYEEAFTKAPLFDDSRGAFEWDGDSWYVNTFGHGLFGSELYLRARTCHLPWYGALAFAAASSAVWEYAFEGNGVRPSALDLVWTPLAGSLLGEARYLGWGASKHLRSPALREAARVVLDPFGEIERALGTDC